MRTTIVDIGNSKGVRIPKLILEESGIKSAVDMKLIRGRIVISPIKTPPKKKSLSPKDTRYLWGPSYSAFAKEWDTPDEDKAWASLQ